MSGWNLRRGGSYFLEELEVKHQQGDSSSGVLFPIPLSPKNIGSPPSQISLVDINVSGLHHKYFIIVHQSSILYFAKRKIGPYDCHERYLIEGEIWVSKEFEWPRSFSNTLLINIGGII